MAKFVSDIVLDSFLDKIATGTSISVTSAQPTNRNEAVATYKLATNAIDSNDFVKSDGNTSGRKVTISPQNNINIDTSGLATHIAICDNSNLLYVTTCSPQEIYTGNTVTIPAWNIEISDAA